MDRKLGRLILLGLLLGPVGAAAQDSAKPLPQDVERLIARFYPTSGKCIEAAEAADELENAANDLASCAGNDDYSDDCSYEASDASDAADRYETAVNEAEGDCQ